MMLDQACNVSNLTDSQEKLNSFSNSAPPTTVDLLKQYQAVREGAGLFDLCDWTRISITGPDRITFLHGLVSNEVKRLSSGKANYSLFLTPQGKIIADFHLLACDQELILFGKTTIRNPLFDGLNKYLIMEEVEIHDATDSHTLFSVRGLRSVEKSALLLNHNSLPDEYNHIPASIATIPCLILHVPHSGKASFDILAQCEHRDSLRKAFLDAGIIPIGADVEEILRVEAGIPLLGQDIDQKTIPQEAHLDHAISYTKGCYVGQEVMARLHFRGHVNRELTGFILETDEIPQTPLSIVSDAKDVGIITSVVYSLGLQKTIGLGFLRCELRDTGTAVDVFHGEQHVKAFVHPLPFV